MSLLEPSELRQLRLFGWFLLLINGCIVAMAVALGHKVEDQGAGWLGMAALIVAVDGAFGLIVGVDIAVVVLRRWRTRH